MLICADSDKCLSAEFYAANNMISGSLPTELGIMPSLQILALSDNVLSGTLPSELGRASSLLVLSVPLNDLTGTLPSALVNMSSIGKKRNWLRSLLP